MSVWTAKWWNFPTGGELVCSEGRRTGARLGVRNPVRAHGLSGTEPEPEGAALPTDGVGIDNVKRAAARARGVVRRVIRFYRLVYMLTLTFPDNGPREFGDANALVSEWFRRAGHRFTGAHVLRVPELQQRGVWHFHLMTERRIDVIAARISWTRWLTSRGMPPSGGARLILVNATHWGDSDRAARYASKYVTKKCEVPFGRHRYEVNGDTQEPVPAELTIESDDPFGVLRQVMELGLPENAWSMVMVPELVPDWTGPPLVIARW